MSQPEPIDPILESLYREERTRARRALPETRARVMHRLLDRIDRGPGGEGGDQGGAPPPKTSMTSSTAGTLSRILFGAVIGASITWAFMRDRGEPSLAADAVDVAAHENNVTAVPSRHSAPIVTETELVAVDAEQERSARRPRAVRHPDAPESIPASAIESIPSPEDTTSTSSVSEEGVSASSSAEERALIDRARAALHRGEAHEALVALMSHERRFVDGELTEERERLIIEALVVEGRRDQARARIDAYLARQPHGIHRAALERLAESLRR